MRSGTELSQFLKNFQPTLVPMISQGVLGGILD